MQYGFLGTTGVRVSRLCLGTMTFDGEADVDTATAMFVRAREAGINFFDTADVYNRGRSEELLGRLIADCRDEVVIATKGYFPTGADRNARGSTRYHLTRTVEASLKRLGTDRIDLFYLHRFDEATDLEDTLRTVEDLVRAGKILYPAVSNFAAWQGMKALGIARLRGLTPIAAFQPMYNLVKRQAESEILPMCAAEGLAVVPYSPTAGGLLTGKYGVGARPPGGRLVDNAMYATRYRASWNYDTAELFSAFAKDRGIHPVTLAVAWAASHPAVTAPILGARSVEQLEPALSALDLDMSELRAEVSALAPSSAPATDRNEETSSDNYGTR